ncbi:S8 family serine peptidase [Halorubrum sp. DTA46]|uniref:S8 family serine peptidase n=1 Tax=Halorubrum sp. DTA46 TaxID=3402162 RepID=UPI003AAB5166
MAHKLGRRAGRTATAPFEGTDAEPPASNADGDGDETEAAESTAATNDRDAADESSSVADTSRRSVLISTGALAGAGLLTGEAAASPGNRPEEVVIGTGSRAAQRAVESRAESVSRVLDFADIGQAVSGRFPPQAIEALERRADVRYVERDGAVPPLGQTLPWGVDRVDADRAHAAGETGAGGDVAIIDSGIDSDHEDLAANLGEGYAVVTCSGCAEPWDDDQGHGTHCAGIAGAVDNDVGVVGVSTEATLHAVKVFDADAYATVSGLSEGIKWVADQGYDVGSMSLGAASSYATLRDACRYAADRGVLLVAAAGNDGCSDCVNYPAAYDSVVAVSATTSSDSLASYSSYGPEIELAAPGSYVYSTVPGSYGRKSGTSMACPHVAGAGGQLMANGYTSTEARARLRDTAEDIGLSAAQQGAGLLDVEAAVDDGGDGGDDDGDGDGDGDDSDDGDGEETAPLAVSTTGASDVGESSATLDGSLDELPDGDTATAAFEYRQQGADTWSTTDTTTLTATGAFGESVTGLTDGADYEFRAVAETESDADAGTTLAFTTDAVTVTVDVSTTGSVAVDETSATLEGTLDVLDGASSAEVAFEWGVSGEGLPETTTPETLSATGTFDATLSDLAGGTDYEFRAVADADGTTDAGETLTLTSDTADEPAAAEPVVDDYVVSEAGSPNPHAEITAKWAVSDADGDLDSVSVEVLDRRGRVRDSIRTNVAGSQASGIDELRVKHARNARFDVRLTVTDRNGHAVTETRTVST